MSSRTIVMCVSVGASLSGWMLSPTRAAILFQDTSEGRTAGTAVNAAPPPIGDQYGTQGVVRDTTTNPPGSAAGGTKFVQIGGGLDNRWYITPANQTAVTNQVVQFDASFYIVTDNASATKAIDYNTFTNNGFAGRGFDILIHSDGSLEYYDGTYHSVAVAGTVHTGAWIATSVLADFAAGTYSATIDGFNFLGAFSGGAGHPTNFLTVVPDLNSGATGFYDSITIGTPPLPEPGAIGVAALGGITFAFRRRQH
jgi:hypothetical protein